MAHLTEKGLAKLETLRDLSNSYLSFSHSTPPSKFSSVKMHMKYLLQEIEKNSEFYIEQHSILRPDWNRLKDQRLIIDTSSEPTYVIEGTNRPLYRK